MSRILVVDDETDIAETIRAVLETEGYQVDTAGDGRECLLRLTGERPDLVLLDVMMPEVDGLEVLRRMESDGFDSVPVVLMSAVGPREPPDARNLRAFLSKPFHLDALLDTVGRALN